MSIHNMLGIEIRYKEPINTYTFTKVGGIVDILALPKNIEEIQELLQVCKEENMQWMVIGNASNIIILDGGFRGMVIMLTNMNNVCMKDNTMIVEAGASLIGISQYAMEKGYTGLEFACGIPGSIGGAAYMNAGAYDSEMSQVVFSVTIINEQGDIEVINKEALQFSYRYSKLQDRKCVILSVTLVLAEGNKKEIQEKMAHLTMLRETKQPLEYPSCGSVFKRPKGYFTGKLIQDAGLQGKQIGGAQVSLKHAGFIINTGHAVAQDYIDLIQYIQKEIYNVYQIQLETEVEILGEVL